jgi:uncharacterized protein (DUF58 family)
MKRHTTSRGASRIAQPGATARTAGESPAAGVYTRLEDLVAMRQQARGFSFLPRQPVHSLLAGRHASRLRGRGLNFDEIRRYQAGDDIRQIDWKVTARTRKTHTRVFTEERERTTLLVVDQRISMFFGSVRRMKSVTAAEAAALAAWRVLQQQDRVGALVFNDTDIVEVRPLRSQSAVMRILQAIATQNQALSVQRGEPGNPGMLNEALRRCDRLAKHDYLICIVSDGAGQDEDTQRLLTRIARHNDILFAFVHDPLEGELPAAGPLYFGDGRDQLEVDTGQRTLRERFRDDFAAALATGRQFLMQRDTPVIPLNTVDDVADQVRQRLGTRRR